MKQCVRCDRWHNGKDSEVCPACWVELGQMELALEAPDWEPEPDAPDDEYQPEIDTIFDRMAERENRFP
jgi:hypothetical protein